MQLKDYLHQQYSPKTAKAYLREINIYLNNNPSANNYQYSHITQYMGIVRKRYGKHATISRILASLKAYYDYLCATAYRNDNPCKAIQLKGKHSKDVQLQDLFTSPELEGLLNNKTERFPLLASRNKTLISLFIYQALKPAEAAALELKDINLEEASIYIKSTPKSNSRTLSLNIKQILLFKEYIETSRPKLLKKNSSDCFIIGHRGTGMTGEDITKHIKRSYKNYSPPRKVNALSIRQSVITNLLKQNKDLRIVQAFAGHKYPSSTEKYKQSDVEALQTALQIYHPIK